MSISQTQEAETGGQLQVQDQAWPSGKTLATKNKTAKENQATTAKTTKCYNIDCITLNI